MISSFQMTLGYAVVPTCRVAAQEHGMFLSAVNLAQGEFCFCSRHTNNSAFFVTVFLLFNLNRCYCVGVKKDLKTKITKLGSFSIVF